MIKAVIFDCFGVIISDGLSVILQELGRTNPEAKKYVIQEVDSAITGQIETTEYVKRVSEHLGISEEEWKRNIKEKEYKDQEVMDFIKSLRPRYKTAMLSNVGRGGIERRFAPEEMQECFDEVVVSAEVGVQKPDPKIYQYTAEKLLVSPSECVFIDDLEPYCDAARAVGMQAIWYRDFEQMKTDLEKILLA